MPSGICYLVLNELTEILPFILQRDDITQDREGDQLVENNHQLPGEHQSDDSRNHRADAEEDDAPALPEPHGDACHYIQEGVGDEDRENIGPGYIHLVAGISRDQVGGKDAVQGDDDDCRGQQPAAFLFHLLDLFGLRWLIFMLVLRVGGLDCLAVFFLVRFRHSVILRLLYQMKFIL